MLFKFPVIIADESVDARIIAGLVQGGYSVISVAQESPGISDTDVIALAMERSGYIITEDKDFGDELVYRKVEQIGSMLLRITETPAAQKVRIVVQTIDAHGNELLGAFAVLSQKKLRIRQY